MATDATMDLAWYAVHAQASREEVAEANLVRLGVETLLPRIHRRPSRRGPLVGPLFPGYLFARLDLERHLRAASYARGVRRVVAFGSVPAVVPEEIIEGIRARLGEDGCAYPASQFQPGQVVRIAHGPLEGLEAVFEREMTGQDRVVLLLRTLSYAGRLVVPAGAVAAL